MSPNNHTIRPSVFIGSSREGLEIAEAIQSNLDHLCEVTIWSQGIFGLSSGTLDTLVKRGGDFDFAILVLTPDDLTNSRDVSKPSPRDNVVFELGLFMGLLGSLRTFVVHERSTGIKLPSDLAGVTLADFQRHSSGNLQATLGAASTRIKTAIQELGYRSKTGTSSTDINQSSQYSVIGDLLDPSALQFLILMHEKGITLVKGDPFLDQGIRYTYELKNRGGGGSGYFSARKLCERLPDAGLLQVDLRDRVSLTPKGQEFAKWAIETGRKADSFPSDIGGWGTITEHWSWGLPQAQHPSQNQPRSMGKRK
jgi:hypothetical protein